MCVFLCKALIFHPRPFNINVWHDKAVRSLAGENGFPAALPYGCQSRPTPIANG